ncbi:MAG: DUF1574 domain-containing protein [Leptospira sp.]|nr:DUF1574 domain-containing protein [Leptospira sp.]NCS95011.1 DUF1574 domain-containing protein [Leptospira sp.]
MKFKIFLYPVLIFLIIFCIDKLSIIPSIQKLGRIENSPLENIANGVAKIYKKKKIENELQTKLLKESSNLTDSKKSAVVLGTSRSDILKFSERDFIQQSKFITQKEKEKLLQFEIETRSVVKASDFLYHLILFKNIVDSGYKPNLVIIEVSPETTNLNSPFHAKTQYTTNILKYQFLIELSQIAEKSWLKTVLTSVLFPSSYYKFKPEKAISNLIAKKDYLSDNNVIEAYEFFPATAALPTSYEDYEVKSFPLNKFQERIVDYSNHLHKDNILRNYQISTSELALFDLLLKEIKSSKIPVVFWRPKVHPYYYAIQMQEGLAEIDSLLENKIKEAGYSYINLQNTSMNCDFFTDSSHHSGRCAPEILSKILSTE